MSDSFDIEKFPTSQSAVRMMSRISPIYEKSYVGKWIFQVMGLEMDEIRLRFEELALQAFPETATWGLAYWEQRYGITPSGTDTMEQRRRRVLSMRNVREPMNPAKMEQIIQTMTGCPVKVTENVAPYTFSVEIFADGSEIDFDAVFRRLKRIKPSHQRMLLYMSTTTGIQIKPAREAYPFPYRMAGTYPDTNIVGVLQHAEVDVEITRTATGFTYPMTGEHAAGTIPQTNILAAISEDSVAAHVQTSSASFEYPLCGDNSD